MKIRLTLLTTLGLLIWGLMASSTCLAATSAVDGKAKASNTNLYLDFTTSVNANVTVDLSSGDMAGYAWLEDVGWCDFGVTDNPNGPVNLNMSTGAVTGKAYCLNTSKYIHFTNYNSNVTASLTTGAFTGYAWSEDVGWLDFGDSGVTYGVPAPTSTPTPTPTSSPSNNNNSSSSSGGSGVPSCTDTPPYKAPDLYQINTTKDTATLYFVPAGNPVDKYYVEYTTVENQSQHGFVYDERHTQSALRVTVKALNSNTNYYFKIRGGNGCATSQWSTTLKAKTNYSATRLSKFYRYTTPKGK